MTHPHPPDAGNHQEKENMNTQTPLKGLTVEYAEPEAGPKCPDCDTETVILDRMVFQHGRPFALACIECSEHEPGAVVFHVMFADPKTSEPSGTDFSARLRVLGDNYVYSLTHGSKTHPRVGDFWSVCDHVLGGDSYLRTFIEQHPGLAVRS